MTPPQYPGAVPTQPSTWPTVIGILMIIIGSIGLLIYGCGGAVSTIMPSILSGAANSPNANQDPVTVAQLTFYRTYLPWNIGNAVVLIAQGALVLVAGIRLLRRRSSAARFARLWAVARLVWVVPQSVVGYLMSAHMFQALADAGAQSGQPMPGNMMALMQGFGVIGAVMGAVFYSAFPIFLLIWFSRTSIRGEMAQWSDGTDSH
jgi:hypothetical protein